MDWKIAQEARGWAGRRPGTNLERIVLSPLAAERYSVGLTRLHFQNKQSGSAVFESLAEFIAIFDTVEAPKIFRVRFTRFHLEIDENRPILFQNVV